MPCRCDYMEPTPQEIKTELMAKVRALQSWDFSKIERYLAKSGMPIDQVELAINQYKEMMMDGMSLGRSIKPGVLEDKVLHAHILHTDEFDKFKKRFLTSFNHTPEVEYTPNCSSIDSQLLHYALYAKCTPETLISDPVYQSGELRSDWGFLVAYLCSDECEKFSGTKDDALKLVFDYLRSIIPTKSISEVVSNSDLRTVLESHILHTDNFADFRQSYLGRNFVYEPS